ncbi:MAG: dockerin type I repeat-containing protein, partial [Gemmatimonadota bacterium]|nr:dockerin type I repeat-containing protein [Gemmatimonadota bacterium]
MRLLSLILLWAVFFLQPSCLSARDDPEKNPGPAAVLSGLGANPGDVNRDSRTDIFDLFSLLWVLTRKNEPTPSADLDKDGQVNIFDLLALLRYLGSPPEPDSDFEFLVVLNKRKLLSGESIFLWGGIGEDGKVSTLYKIYSNKEIEEAILVFGGDTLTELEGRTPILCDADTISVPFGYDLSCGHIPWYVRVSDAEGNWRDTMGITEFTTNPRGTLVDPGYPLTGGLIDFPLVLKGPLQRFIIPCGVELPGDTFRIDLNRSRADSVVFPDIDSLATAIMEDLAENDSIWNEINPLNFPRLYVSPAFERSTSRNANRLYFEYSVMAEVYEIIP